MARVTGIGGVFLKAKDPKTLAVWYAKHLNVALSDYGGITFRWSDEVPATSGATAWALFPETTKNFGSGPQTAMINYRVDDLDGLLAQMEKDGVVVDPKRENYGEFGKFGWITDPEGNRVELWQPVAKSEKTV
ncbi:VOC family protein [Granulicella tundricola]|uniref:Glyoxalase/bleomycin resistance protein/dioxygenase n=1 Tax=Granulicella tundricola (strain ATCC BAA-1859 / DSM 23138 / MP5ACTX9) TaxID=1198114 RepID=E8X1K7_GRATM|nr:VOC family protein [Granulicella tundricola]ADW70242.1 Glyoxalase/bleomycin resistance protein/dioxygenase [Granulicella tundricola MP5ACTX9]